MIKYDTSKCSEQLIFSFQKMEIFHFLQKCIGTKNSFFYMFNLTRVTCFHLILNSIENKKIILMKIKLSKNNCRTP